MTSTYRLTKSDFKLPAVLVALSIVPAVGGIVRLMSVAGDTLVTPDNARFLQSPAPVVVHAISATLFSMLGAFQFQRGFRLRWPTWHRRAGRLLAVAGLATGLTGLWMTARYPIPLGMQGHILYWVRLAVGVAMVTSLVIAWRSILRRQVARHEAWMIRAYALAQGAATQALVLTPWILITGVSTGLMRDLLMTLSWVINVVLAELIIRRMRAGHVGHAGHARAVVCHS